jgi:hypothetical protein
MNTLILGSGFGIYGYLPAVYKLSKKIFLKEKYKKKIHKRYELNRFLKKIVWYKEKNIDFKKINYLIIAQNPKKQDQNIRKLAKKLMPKHVFLEKPISNNPINSIKLIRFLEKIKLKFSVGYLFKYLSWYDYVKYNISSKQTFRISWHIKFNMKNNSWKNTHHSGGGLMRFYAIHFIRIFYDLKFLRLNEIKIKKNFCYFEVLDIDDNKIILNIKFSKVNKFYIKHNKKICFSSINPFLKRINKKLDPRIVLLNSYIKDQINNNKFNYEYEKKFICFWNKIEKSCEK